jgi:hypothetical protein
MQLQLHGLRPAARLINNLCATFALSLPPFTLLQVPAPFNLEAVMKAKADDPSALHVVLFQEVRPGCSTGTAGQVAVHVRA